MSASFKSINRKLTKSVVDQLGACSRESAVLAEAPPGAGKSTLTAAVAHALVRQDRKLQLPIVTQTNEQADDLALRIARDYKDVRVARIVASSGPSNTIAVARDEGLLNVDSHWNDFEAARARILVSTARKWQYERANRPTTFDFGLIDEAYQMRSDSLLGVSPLVEVLFCVGDPGQLDPFSTVPDDLWKGLPYAPTRSAMGTLRAFHPSIEPILLPRSWRLPPNAAGVVASAFYPDNPFQPGTGKGTRRLTLGKRKRRKGGWARPVTNALEKAAANGWAYLELPEQYTPRTDTSIAATLAEGVDQLLSRGARVRDELNRKPKALAAERIAVIAAHNDQVHAVRLALRDRGLDPSDYIVSTANKIQGREYDVVFVWHPLAGRRDATAFHLESGRMCVMLSRHRHACIVVGRAGARRLLAEFPDSDPVYLEEPENFPDGWEANHRVLVHLEQHRVKMR